MLITIQQTVCFTTIISFDNRPCLQPSHTNEIPVLFTECPHHVKTQQYPRHPVSWICGKCFQRSTYSMGCPNFSHGCRKPVRPMLLQLGLMLLNKLVLVLLVWMNTQPSVPAGP
ncbi:hypothetical protein AMECASPLE_024524 [Ameca splendens]|uniref:Uncharacterized protein n=1 Tax=Ameca splendens TaxID=208324 RepID=A0ABV0Y4W9_9TELE